MDRGGLVTTTERSLAIIETVQKLDGAPASRLAEETNLAVSTVHKHLQTLTASGYLRKKGIQYHLGFQLLNLSESVRHSINGSELISDHIQWLSDETGEEVDFSVESNGRAITVREAYHDKNPYRSGFVDSSDNRWEVGVYYPLHSIASGKAILAELSNEEVNSVIDQWGLSSFGPNTITNEDALHRELHRIHEQGYATTTEEYAKGLCGIARAVDLEQESCGAIGISIPAYRFEQTNVFERLKENLLKTVDELEAELASE